VATLAEEDGARPPAIAEQLRVEAAAAQRNDSPSERTVRRLYDQHLALPEHVRREQGRLRWPRSFAIGALPWEASRAALDLLKFCDESGLAHPTARQAKWFWRLRLASPEIPTQEAQTASFTLAVDEYLSMAGIASLQNTSLEWRLAYEPWAGLNQKEAFERVCERHPERRQAFGFSITGTREELNAVSSRTRSFVAGTNTARGEASNG
jgi:hypothetical protein